MTTIPDNDNPTSLDARARRLHADALATVLTVLGPQQGMEFALQHDIAAVLRAHGQERQAVSTPAWVQRFGA